MRYCNPQPTAPVLSLSLFPSLSLSLSLSLCLSDSPFLSPSLPLSISLYSSSPHLHSTPLHLTFLYLGLFQGESNELSPETIGRLIRRPEDLEENVEKGIGMYKDKMLRLLEDYMADHDQQYLIELDANKPVKVLFPVRTDEFLKSFYPLWFRLSVL